MSDLQPTVFIIDDDEMLLKALLCLFQSAGLQVVGFSSPQAYLEQHDPEAPGCMVLDVQMPEIDGLLLQQMLVAEGDTLPVVFLSGHGDIPISVRAMKQGASDFLTKPVEDIVLLAAVQTAIEKDRIVRQKGCELREIDSLLATLTLREREVLDHVVTGQLNKQIAADLGTGEKNIKVHRGRVMHKLKVRSLAELVRLYEKAVRGRTEG
jgi:FixJ family two-component response regulator